MRPAPKTASLRETDRALRARLREREPCLCCWIDARQFRPDTAARLRAGILHRVLGDFAAQSQGQVYPLRTGDILAVIPLAAEARHPALIGKLELVLRRQQAGLLGDLAHFHRLPDDYQALLDRLEGVAERAEALDAAAEVAGTAGGRGGAGGDAGGGAGARPLDVTLLTKLEASLRGSDLTGFISHQPVVRFTREGVDREVFREYFLAFERLAQAVLPGYDLKARGSHFQFLTGLVDSSVVGALGELLAARPGQAVSLNLSLETSAENDKVLAGLKLLQGQAGTLLVEFAAAEVFAHLDEYLILRDYLRTLGIRVVIDRIRPSQLPLIDSGYLRADHYKLLWTDALTGGRERNAAFARFVESAGSRRLVLSQCDSLDALEYGVRHDLVHFQGWTVDRLLQQTRSEASAPAATPQSATPQSATPQSARRAARRV